MKIINKGKWDNPWSANILCAETHCQAELEIDEKDLIPKGYKYSNGGATIKCPVCGHETFVQDKLPTRIKESLEAKRKDAPPSSSSWDR